MMNVKVTKRFFLYAVTKNATKIVEYD